MSVASPTLSHSPPPPSVRMPSLILFFKISLFITYWETSCQLFAHNPICIWMSVMWCLHEPSTSMKAARSFLHQRAIKTLLLPLFTVLFIYFCIKSSTHTCILLFTLTGIPISTLLFIRTVRGNSSAISDLFVVFSSVIACKVMTLTSVTPRTHKKITIKKLQKCVSGSGCMKELEVYNK